MVKLNYRFGINKKTHIKTYDTMLVSNQTLKEGFNMCQQNNNTKSKKGKHLDYGERQSIERWWNRDKRTKVEIAGLLDRTEKTIRNEIKSPREETAVKTPIARHEMSLWFTDSFLCFFFLTFEQRYLTKN